MKNPAVDVLLTQAAAHQRLGRVADVIAVCRQAVALQPDDAGACNQIGMLLSDCGQFDEAAKMYARALELSPGAAAAAFNLGNALRSAGRDEEAMAAYRRAVDLQADLVPALVNLSALLNRFERFDEAEAVLRQAVAGAPGHPVPYINLANFLSDKGQLEEALDCIRRGVELAAGSEHQPYRVSAGNNLATVLMDCDRVGEAIDKCRQLMATGADTPVVRNTLARALLKVGNLSEGLMYYEARFEGAEPFKPAPVFPVPRWDGGNLAGRTILIYDEQGAGDTIQFARYLPLVVARGGRILFQCRPGLVRLLVGDGSGPAGRGVSAIVKSGDALSRFDVHSPLMSLPWLFKTTIDTIPADVPYVFADRALAAAWRARVEKAGDGLLKVGIVWAGSTSYQYNRRRSIAPRLLAPLTKVGGVRVFSLQIPAKTGPAVDAERTAAEMGMTDWTAELADYADTAALVANLDLVISVDSSVAHVAGAMGKRVWTLIPFNGDWRWFSGREDSPWYPTMRLFRQERQGGWSGAINRVAEALAELAAKESR